MSDVPVYTPLKPYNTTSFTPDQYIPSDAIVRIHNSFRFGKSNDIGAAVVEGNREIQENYILGITAGAMLIFAIALFMFTVLMIIKCAGPKRVGFLAGRLNHPYYDGNTPDLIDQDVNEYDAKKDKKFKTKVGIVRLMFVISGSAVVICVVLFYIKGMAAFRTSIDETSQGLQLIDETANSATDILNSAMVNTDKLVSEFNTIMTATDGQICKGDTDIATGIRDKFGEVDEVIAQFKESFEKNAGTAIDGLAKVTSTTQEVADNVDKANICFVISLIVSIIIGVLIFGMFMVAFFSYMGVSNACTKLTTYAMLWPIFMFFLIVFLIFALLFLVASLSGADFCVSPDEIVQSYLTSLEERADISSIEKQAYDFGLYYIGCESQYAPDLSKITEVTDYLNEINTQINDYRNIPPILIAGFCGLTISQATALHNGLNNIYDTTNILNEDVAEALELIECKTINPIYTTFVHDAVCTKGVYGLQWLFGTSVFLVFFSVVLFMFRAAMYPVKWPIRPSDQGMKQVESYPEERQARSNADNGYESKQKNTVDEERKPEKDSFTDIIRPAKFDDDDGDEEYPEVGRLNPNDRFPQYPPPVSQAQF